jgi:hypothetical protein
MLSAPAPKRNVTHRLRGVLLGVILVCGVAAPVVAFAQMTVETAALGMTGWRTKPVAITVETATLGMTGWRTKRFALTIETATLGMTGWGAAAKAPERTHPFEVAAANLILFHDKQPLPERLRSDCPVPIGHKALFATKGKLPGKIAYHFEWSSGQRSTDYTKLDTGDRNDPLYEPPSRFHEFPYPLPVRDQSQGDLNRMAANETDSGGPEQLTAPTGPANEHKGSVRVVVPNPYGAPVVSGWARFDVVCNFKPGLVQRPRTVCVGGSVAAGQCLCPSTTEKIRAGANAWRCVKPRAPTPGSQP